jgi:hypothetical protein
MCLHAFPQRLPIVRLDDQVDVVALGAEVNDPERVPEPERREPRFTHRREALDGPQRSDVRARAHHHVHGLRRLELRPHRMRLARATLGDLTLGTTGPFARTTALRLTSARSWRRVTRPPALVHSRFGEPEGDRFEAEPVNHRHAIFARELPRKFDNCRDEA